MKHFIQTLLTLLLTVGASATLLAGPPPKKICDYPDDVYKQLECKTGAIAEQLGYTSDVAFEESTGLGKKLGQPRLNHLKHSANKADRAALKHDAKTFKRLAKAQSRGNKGQDVGNLVPLPFEYDERDNDNDYNQDGICDYEQPSVQDYEDAWCLAIELNDAGNPQKCNPNKKNKGKGKGGGSGKFDGLECDRFIDFGDDEEADMELAAINLLESYEATEENLLEMNETLDEVNDLLAQPPPAAVLNGENGENEEDCTDEIDNDGDGLIDGVDPDCTKCDRAKPRPGLRHLVITLRESAALADGAAAIAADIAGQDAAGFNARASAVILHGVWTVAVMAHIATEEIENHFNSEAQDLMMDCIAQSADQMAETLTKIMELQGQLKHYVEVVIHDEHDDIMKNDNTNTTTIMDNDDKNKTEIVHVLNTPHGQRDDHPKP